MLPARGGHRGIWFHVHSRIHMEVQSWRRPRSRLAGEGIRFLVASGIGSPVCCRSLAPSKANFCNIFETALGCFSEEAGRPGLHSLGFTLYVGNVLLLPSDAGRAGGGWLLLRPEPHMVSHPLEVAANRHLFCFSSRIVSSRKGACVSASREVPPDRISCLLRPGIRVASRYLKAVTIGRRQWKEPERNMARNVSLASMTLASWQSASVT